MPADLPKHNDPVTYQKGNWVPVGWKPLVTSDKTRKAVFAAIARRNAEALDKESQLKALKKKKEEKKELKRRAAEELQKTDLEIETLKQRREELVQVKHTQFGKLKAVIQRESLLKKAEEEKKRREASINCLFNPLAQAKTGAVQSTSLISQQNLINQQVNQQVAQQFYHHPSTSNMQNILHFNQILQQMTRPAQSASAKPVITQQILHPTPAQTPQIRTQMIPPAAQSPFYPGSNYASPAPSRNLLPQQQSVSSPRRDRPMGAPMASPGVKFAGQQQSRHNSFIGGTRPINTVDRMGARVDSPAANQANSPLLVRGIHQYHPPAEAEITAALARGYLFTPQQNSPQRK